MTIQRWTILAVAVLVFLFFACTGYLLGALAAGLTALWSVREPWTKLWMDA